MREMTKMKNIVLLDGEKKKLKGNLHTHSTRSDGQYEPEDVIQAYKDRGYDFMCLSDHEIYFKSNQFDNERFIVLHGYEMACEMSRRITGQQYHIHGLLDSSLCSENEFEHDEEHVKPNFVSLDTIQSMMDEMICKGNMIIMNHPEWSRNKPEDLLKLQGYSAIEIYNHQSELDEAAGYGLSYWDYLLRNGRRVFGIAADDAHRGDYRAAISEFFGGWVGVQAEELRQESIISALKRGSFYSSSGPEIYDLRVEEGQLIVKSSPVKYIKFIAYPEFGFTSFNTDGAPMNSAVYPIKGNERYIRVECIDFEGHTAWSNPVYID
jgi:hypothetical protein